MKARDIMYTQVATVAKETTVHEVAAENIPGVKGIEDHLTFSLPT